jgi:hypothetical protein
MADYEFTFYINRAPLPLIKMCFSISNTQPKKKWPVLVKNKTAARKFTR